MSPYNLLVSKTLQMLGATSLLMTGVLHADCETYCCGDSSLQIGGSYTWADIKVANQPSFSGSLGGIQAIYEYKPANSFYGALKAAWKQGSTSRSHGHRNLIYVDAQERVGYTYSSCCDWSVSLFSGFGYRYLGHQLKQPGESSIRFDYNEFYVPVGFVSEYFFSPCWSLGVNFIWMPQVYPTVEIRPLHGARWCLKNTYGNVLVELPLTYSWSIEDTCYSFIFKPFYERWEDGHSTARTFSGESLGLPKNTYNFWGAEFNFAFTF